MTSLVFMLMMQYVISTKAGLVNHVQGDVNVKAAQSVEVGTPIKTESGAFAEILLSPGSYLRLGENSEAVLDTVELTNIAVRLVSGTAVIEAVGFDKEWPLRVTTGNFAAEIVKDGIYKFEAGKVTIVEGKLQDATDRKLAFGKGWQLSKDKSLRAVKAPKAVATPVELWSRQRSELIASANVNVANSLRRSPNINAVWTFSNAWLWVPGLGSYIFMPGYGFRSPYGYRYRTVVDDPSGSSAAAGGGPYEPNRGGGGGSSGSSGGGSSVGSSGASTPIESRPVQSQIGVDRPAPALGKTGL